MKKICLFAFLFLFLLAFPRESHAASSSSHLQLDGKDISVGKGVQIQEVKGNILVPLRLIVEELGYSVNWESKTGTITIHKQNLNLSLQVNNPMASVNDHQMGLAVAPLLREGTTYVPLRFVSEQTGVDVVWNNELKTVFLTTPPASSGNSESTHDHSATPAVSNPKESARTAINQISFANHQLTIAVNGKVTPKVTTLTHADRIVVDIPDTKFAEEFLASQSFDNSGQGSFPVTEDPDVSQVRYSMFSTTPASVRIVVDLNNSTPFHILNADDGKVVIALDQETEEPSTTENVLPTIPVAPVISSDGHAQGIDVSHYNGNIDWQQVAAAGKTFAFIKATEGTKYQDNQFLINVQGAREANILVGAYHFLNATTADGARQEAANFARALDSAGGRLDLPPVMDYENNPKGLTPAQINEVAHAFLDEMERLTGRQPIVYTGNVFASKFDPTFSMYKLWVARYSTTQKPTAVPAWNNWWAWQYSSTGSVPGIRGQVDLDEYNGTIDELRASLGGELD
ncbi:GH25 family lysozyme [Paenibacillus sp. SEL3]|uniref:Lysozyme n=1 Tax=Paenibacillus polymyxa TaxID=1406 RepID=A0A8I1ISC9_PAEPO|nr:MULTISPECIES: GH25 family lysozyme [Paenibacillus]KAF6572403.1 AMIN domain-containing protein [Paenibacillus sp. EKM206P]KAF6586814.1 AMIN domain-containing protein [Paenibacillus sp. EKM205P]MBM0635057.1 AMIN domain-containing protein [Paenibacillus polymyxa]UMY53090.1 AMIN domain-containing protein [Paenibacillus peoriae]